MTKDARALLRTVRLLAKLPAAERGWVVRRLTMPERRTLDEFWPAWAHEGQAPPGGDWPTWTIIAGRGFGKTRAGAEWVSDLARRPSTLRQCSGQASLGMDGPLRIALVGATIEDVVKVMVTGESGIAAVARTGERVKLVRSQGLVHFASGALGFLYSGACPDKLRGPQHHFAWCDEIAKWRHGQEAWDNLQLGLRLGARPRSLVTTTPRAGPLVRKLIAASIVTGGRMADNPHLPPAFIAGMEAEFRGTRKGREELDGEVIEEIEGALWSRALIERCRVAAVTPDGCGQGPSAGFAGPPPLQMQGRKEWRRIVIGVDPPATAGGDACGIVACALGADEVAYVIGDHSVRGLSPEGWAAKTVEAARAWGADCVIVERNQGGDMTTSVLKAADPALPIRPAFARYGKGDRAEPVAMLFETGQAKFAGHFPELEDELCALTRGGGYAGPGRSPDRADAMVWAMGALKLGGGAPPRVREL